MDNQKDSLKPNGIQGTNKVEYKLNAHLCSSTAINDRYSYEWKVQKLQFIQEMVAYAPTAFIY